MYATENNLEINYDGTYFDAANAYNSPLIIFMT